MQRKITFSIAFLLITTLVIFANRSMAQEPVSLGATQDKISLGRHLEILEDPAGQLTINQVSSPEFSDKFVAGPDEIPNFGYTTSAHWARFQIENNCPTCQNWLLEISDPTLDSVELYLFDNTQNGIGDNFVFKQSGDLLPFSARDVAHHNLVFNLAVAPRSSGTAYLRVQNRGSTPLPLTLWTPLAFAQKNNNELFGFGFYYGFIFIMVFYNLFLFFSLREKSYLYYVFFVAGLGMYQLSLDGFATQFLWPNQVWWGDIAILVFIGLTLLNSVNFTGHFLQIKQFSPRLNKVLTALKIAAIALTLFSLFPGFYRLVGQLMSLLTVVLVFCGIAAGIVAWRHNFHPARYFLLAWGGVLLGALLVALEMFGLVPANGFTQYGLRFGVFLLVLLLSLALADSINSIKQEKADALERLKRTADELEERVGQRTIELSSANTQLQQEIVKLQQAESLINQQNTFLNNIIESLANPFYVIDIEDYSIQIANSAARQLGTPTMKSCFELTHRRDTPCNGIEHPCPLAMLKQSKAPVVVEHIHFDKDNRPRNVEVHAYPIFDERDNVIQMVEYSIDITERKQSNEQLRQLSRAVEQSGNAIVITDLNGIIEFVNPAFSKITGYASTEAIGQHTSILKSGQHPPEMYKDLWDTVAQGKVWQGELINKKKSGELYWEFATISPVKNNNGETTRYLAVKEDISKRKQAETRLKNVNDALKERLDELSTLNLIVQTVATVTDLETALEIVAGTMTRLLNASRCIVAVLASNQTRLTITIDFSRYSKRLQTVGTEISIEYNPVLSPVIDKGQSATIANPQKKLADTPLQPLVEPDETECLMLVPLLSRGKVIGAIGIDTNQPGRLFTPEEQTLAETVAAQIAGALANARLFERQQAANKRLENEISERKQAQESLQQRNRELALINHTSRAFNSTLKLDQVLQTILDEINNLLDVMGTSFWLRNPESDELVCRQATGPAKDTVLGWRLPSGAGLTGRAAQTGQTLIVSDARADDRHYNKIAQNAEIDIRSLLSLPLLTKGSVIGVLNLVDTQPNRFSEKDLQLLEPVGAVAAAAIENARLFHKVEQANQRMFDELALAREIQQGLLPAPTPNWPDLDVICYTVPAYEIGGDFYRYHAFDPELHPATEGQLKLPGYAFAIGDVSGKGVSAALLMAASLAQFDATLPLEFDAGERLAHLDTAISPYTKPRRKNCAICYIELEHHAGGTSTLHIVNAAGIPPYIKQRTGQVTQPEIGGFALGQGLGAEIGYQQLTLTLNVGDLVIMTTDGVVEANNAANEMLGFERLERILASGPVSGAQPMLAHLKQALAEFTGNAEQHDDFTIIVMQV